MAGPEVITRPEIIRFMTAFFGQLYAPEVAGSAMGQAIHQMGESDAMWLECLPLIKSLVQSAGPASGSTVKKGKAVKKGAAVPDGDAKQRKHRALTASNLFTTLLFDYASRFPTHPAFERPLAHDEAGNIVMNPNGKPKEVRGSTMIIAAGCWSSLEDLHKEQFKTVVQPFLDSLNKQQANEDYVKPEKSDILTVLYEYLVEANIFVATIDKLLKASADAYLRTKTGDAAAPVHVGVLTSPVAAPMPIPGSGNAGTEEKKKRKHKEQEPEAAKEIEKEAEKVVKKKKKKDATIKLAEAAEVVEALKPVAAVAAVETVESAKKEKKKEKKEKKDKKEKREREKKKSESESD